MNLNNENIIIEPNRKHTRKDLFFMILIGIAFFVSAEFLAPVLRHNLRNKIPFADGFFFGISIIYIVYVLSRKIYQKIEIDYENNRLRIEYITLLKKDCENIIPFEELEYEYKKIASRSGGKWTLRIWKNNKKKLNLEERDYGFEKENIDLLVEKLKELE
ncbi:hypothetical protein QWY90_08295 [Flavobacterium paronense]|uniref:DUF5673 domain-containing protein n=1 Tax=Flavobacterium paronense TaxID=1392775 RepID=A0ABV5GHA7_9FLAO|nr:hypothetical protein [Flavobacterium paronense]MDN3677314.1 hypothetical protein [Flavobacterium paronense]